MSDEFRKTGHRKYIITGTILGVFVLFGGIIWFTLPTIACYGIKYNWSREYSMSTLRWLGPRAAGAVWKYEEHYQWGGWRDLLQEISDSVDNENDLSIFVSSFKEMNDNCSRGWTPLQWAIHSGNSEIAKKMIENGADVNGTGGNGETPLHYAVSRGMIELASYLLENGADVNSKNIDGRTPLHHVVQRGNKKITRLLIENGAEVNVGDLEGRTPLYCATRLDNVNMCNLLLGYDADVNSGGPCGWVPLHVAVRLGYFQLANLLLMYGADVHIANNDGDTALHIVASRSLASMALLAELDDPVFLKDKEMIADYVGIADFLIGHGAKVEATNNDGQTPLECCVDPKISTLLRKHSDKSDD